MFPIARLRPDPVYGYATEPVFTSAQRLALQGLHEQTAVYAEGCFSLLFPFLVSSPEHFARLRRRVRDILA